MDVFGRRGRQQERATATLEYVGVAVATAVLLTGIAAGMRPGGTSIGESVAGRIGALVSGEAATWRWRTAREARTGGGSDPVRVSRDELRMEPMLPPVALWARGWETEREVAGATIDASASACALCASVEWSHELGPKAEAGSSGRYAGLAAGLELGGRMALISAELNAKAARRWGAGTSAFAQGRLRGTVGAEADAKATLVANREGVAVDATAGAMAGAVARAEVKTGVDLLGIAIRQSGRVEGWAGAGARGAAGVDVRRDSVSWRLGWGAALGLGGASEWSGSVDTSAVSPRHKRLARDALLASLSVTRFPVTSILRH